MERLHDDNVWKEVKKTLGYFKKHNISATWFSINPTFEGYRAMGFDEEKWKERLHSIKSRGQDIQQHTHFYKGKEGVPKGEGYDLSKEHIRKRLLEDGEWLGERGFDIKGFVSGAWLVSNDLFKELANEGYLFDSSIRGTTIENKFGVLEIPSSARVRKLLYLKLKDSFIETPEGKICSISFHDYDLESRLFRWALRATLRAFKIMNFDFISTIYLYDKVKK